MLESIFAKESLQGLPLGGRTVRGTVRSGPGEATINHRCPSAHTGADEGAIDSPNGAGEGKRRGDRSLLLQGKVGYRIAPSSVTFGDSFPPKGKPSQAVLPRNKMRSPPNPAPAKSAPNQGTYMGSEIAQRPFRCASNAKTSEWQRAGHKKRGSRGQGPRRSFFRLSPEKAGLPPGVGREPTSQVWTCDGPNGTAYR